MEQDSQQQPTLRYYKRAGPRKQRIPRLGARKAGWEVEERNAVSDGHIHPNNISDKAEKGYSIIRDVAELEEADKDEDCKDKRGGGAKGIKQYCNAR